MVGSPTPFSAEGGFEPRSLVGTVLDGRYRIIDHLATGGMGAVFCAEHVYMKKDVALKVLRPDLCSSSSIAERFRREAEIASSLEHENIVRVTDFGKSPDGWLFLTMELLQGEGLFDRLRRLGTLEVNEAIDLISQICSGLSAAHARGVVHRDLKPENIFLCETADGRTVVKILDFGIAKITDPAVSSDTQSGMVVGTPEYLSPEQAVGGVVDQRADLYAVGLVAWRMLAGRHPFKGADARSLILMQASSPVPPLTDLRPDLAVHPGLVSAVARACAKSASDRHPTAADLRRDLETCLEAPGVPLPPISQSISLTADLTHPTLASEPSLVSWPREATLSPFPTWPSPTGSLPVEPDPTVAIRPPKRLGIRRVLAAAAACLLAAGAFAAWRLTHRPLNTHAFNVLSTEILIAAAKVGTSAEASRAALLGHAFHLLPDQAEIGIKSYEEAFARSPEVLRSQALADLAGDLGRDQEVADRAARLLVRVGEPARLAVAAVAAHESGMARFRALELERQLGSTASEQIPAYVSLLSDPDCDVRRASAKWLGVIGSDASVVQGLQNLAQSQRKTRGMLGFPRFVPACGALEAAAALRSIEGNRRLMSNRSRS